MQTRPIQAPKAWRKARISDAASIPNGFRTAAKSRNRPGERAREIREIPTASPVVHANARQRGDGSLPVGKSIRSKMAADTDADCRTVESHATYAPAGNRAPSESATVAYWPEKNCVPEATEETRKSQPMTFLGRRETIRAPKVAKVGPMKVDSTQ